MFLSELDDLSGVEIGGAHVLIEERDGERWRSRIPHEFMRTLIQARQ